MDADYQSKRSISHIYSSEKRSSVLFFTVLFVALFLALAGVAGYLYLKFRTIQTPEIWSDTPRVFQNTSQGNGEVVMNGTIVEAKSISGNEIIRYIHGEVVSFDGNAIKVTWNGQSSAIDLWLGGEEILVSDMEGNRNLVVKGELKLNPGDYVSFQTNDRILVVRPK